MAQTAIISMNPLQYTFPAIAQVGLDVIIFSSMTSCFVVLYSFFWLVKETELLKSRNYKLVFLEIIPGT